MSAPLGAGRVLATVAVAPPPVDLIAPVGYGYVCYAAKGPWPRCSFKHEFAGEMLAALPDSREIQDAATDSPAREHRAIGLWMRLDFSAVGVAECVFTGAGLSEETAEL